MSWLIARTQSRRERYAQSQVERQGRSTYCPFFREHRTKKIVPLFPCYIFISVGDGSWWFLRSTFGLFGPVLRGNQPDIMPDDALANLRKREGKDGLIDVPFDNGLRQGQSITIIGGAMTGTKGIYQGMSGFERCRILFEMLGQTVPATVDRAYVRAVG